MAAVLLRAADPSPGGTRYATTSPRRRRRRVPSRPHAPSNAPGGRGPRAPAAHTPPIAAGQLESGGGMNVLMNVCTTSVREYDLSKY